MNSSENRLKTHEFLFSNAKIQVYGTENEPLFLVNDIVCSILEMTSIGDNQFFRDNRENPTFVTAWEFPTCPLVVQKRYKSNKPSHIYFFTERGLYTCLMKSNKPAAVQCQEEMRKNLDIMREIKQQVPLVKTIEEQSSQIREYQQLTSELNKYKNMLSIQHFLFQDSNVRIQGTNEDPLFHCLDVVKILGCTKANQNWFYKQNKTNTDYITGVIIDHPTKSDKYFTETGLYECLFASDSLIAKQFRKEIIQLLKNIRLGIVGIQILDSHEYSKQLQQKSNELLKHEQELIYKNRRLQELSDEIDSLQEDNIYKTQQLKKATKECNLYKIQVISNNVVEGEYGGITHQNPKTRNYQHQRGKSCNPELRKAVLEGKELVMSVVDTFQYTDDNERKRRERDLIISIPENKRLNVQIPRVR